MAGRADSGLRANSKKNQGRRRAKGAYKDDDTSFPFYNMFLRKRVIRDDFEFLFISFRFWLIGTSVGFRAFGGRGSWWTY